MVIRQGQDVSHSQQLLGPCPLLDATLMVL
jgi:hypothetical protein